MISSNSIDAYELVAITGFRNECIVEGIYTRVEPFIDWILNTMDNPPPTSAPFTFGTIPPATFPTPKPDVLGKTRLGLSR